MFGVKGWIKIKSDTRPVENILHYRRWWIAHGKGFQATQLQGLAQVSGIVAQISGADGLPITDRDIAATLNGAEIQVDRADLPKLPKGEYYWVEMIGLKVQSTEGAQLGQVSDMTHNGAQDVMVVNDGERERMIPFVPEAIVKSVDMDARVVVCDWHPDY